MKRKSSPKASKAKKGPREELHQLKIKLRSYVNATKLGWIGEPWMDGSQYTFEIDKRLVEFVLSVVQRERHRMASKAHDEAMALKKINDLNRVVDGELGEEEFMAKLSEIAPEPVPAPEPSPAPEPVLTGEQGGDSNGYGSAKDQEASSCPPDASQEGSEG